MIFVKMIQDSHVVNVGCAFLKWSDEYDRLFVCDISQAQFAESYDEQYLYHDVWLRKVITDKVEYSEAEIVVIEKDEYDELLELLRSDEVIVVEPPKEEPVVVSETPPEPESPMTISEMRETILNQQKQIDMLLERIG